MMDQINSVSRPAMSPLENQLVKRSINTGEPKLKSFKPARLDAGMRLSSLGHLPKFGHGMPKLY